MYTNSSLANYKIISPNKNVGRLHSIDTVTIHCVVGQTSADSLGYFFQDPDLGASSNYGVGYDGKIGLYVEEKDIRAEFARICDVLHAQIQTAVDEKEED